MTTFLWWEMCSGRKEQVCNVPGGKLLMSTVFHNLFPDSFQGKCIIQNDLSGCIDYSHPKHAWHLKQVVRLSSQAWGGSSASFGSQFQSPRLDSQLGFGLFILLHKSSLNINDGPARILRADLKVTKFPAEFNVDAERKNLDTEIWMCVRGGSATCLWNLLWHLGLKWICISKDKFACAAGAGVVSKHTSCPVWLR